MTRAGVTQSLSNASSFDYCMKLLPGAGFHERPLSNNCFLNSLLHVLAATHVSVAWGKRRMKWLWLAQTLGLYSWKVHRLKHACVKAYESQRLFHRSCFSRRRPSFCLSHPFVTLHRDCHLPCCEKNGCVPVNACLCFHLCKLVYIWESAVQ